MGTPMTLQEIVNKHGKSKVREALAIKCEHSGFDFDAKCELAHKGLFDVYLDLHERSKALAMAKIGGVYND